MLETYIFNTTTCIKTVTVATDAMERPHERDGFAAVDIEDHET